MHPSHACSRSLYPPPPLTFRPQCEGDAINLDVNATIRPLPPGLYEGAMEARYAPCLGWTGNTATQGGFGDILASTPVLYNMTVSAHAVCVLVHW